MQSILNLKTLLKGTRTTKVKTTYLQRALSDVPEKVEEVQSPAATTTLNDDAPIVPEESKAEDDEGVPPLNVNSIVEPVPAADATTTADDNRVVEDKPEVEAEDSRKEEDEVKEGSDKESKGEEEVKDESCE